MSPLPAPEARQLRRLLVLNAAALWAALLLLARSYLWRGVLPATAADYAVFAAWCALLVIAMVTVLELGARALRLILPPLAWRLPYPLLLAVAPAALWLDTRTFGVLDVHLYSPEMVRLLQRTEYLGAARIDQHDVIAVVGAYVAAALVEGALLVLLRPREGRTVSMTRTGRAVGAVVALGAVVLGLGRARIESPRSPLAHALPFHDLLLAQGGRVREFRVVYPPPDASAALPTIANRPDIVLLAVESLRADAATEEHMPELVAAMNHRGCWTSPHHFSSSHLTEFSVFSLLYGLDASRFDSFRRTRTPSLALSRLRQVGYRVQGFGASALLGWHGAGFIADGMDSYEEFLGSRASVDDAAMTDRLLSRSTVAGPSFSYAFFNSTHFPYDYPPASARYLPAADGRVRDVLPSESPSMRQLAKNRYWNAVGYVDTLLGRVLAGVAPETWIVITGDHAEELWDAGGYGHLAARFDDARVEVPMYICAPWAGALATELSGHVDIMPTLLDALGVLPDPDSFDGRSLRGPALADRLEEVNGNEFPNRGETLALVTGGRKLWLVASPDVGDRFSVERVTDLRDRDVPAPSDADLERDLARMRRRFARFLQPL